MYLANNFLTENFVFVLQEKRGKKYIYLQGHWKERGESSLHFKKTLFRYNRCNNNS